MIKKTFHSQSVCKVVHYGRQTGEGQNRDQSKRKLLSGKRRHTEFLKGSRTKQEQQLHKSGLTLKNYFDRINCDGFLK